MTAWQPGPLKHWLELNDSGVWGDDPTGEDDALVVRSTDIRLDGSWSLEDVAERSLPISDRTTKRLAEGDLVVVKSSGSADHLGKTAIVDGQTASLHACFANFVQRLRPASEADPRYVWYLLNSRQAAAEMEMLGNTTTGLRNLNGAIIGSVTFPGPCLWAQRAIADFLGAETAHIDALVAKKRLLEEAIRTRLLATIDRIAWERSNELTPLRRVARFIDYRGATPSKSTSGVPLITASHVRDGTLDIESEPQWVDELTYKEWMRRGWPTLGDVLLTTEAPLGNVAQIIDDRVALAQRVVLLKPKESIVLADFLAFAMRAPSFQHQLMAHATGSTALGIKADRLKALRIPVPSLDEQRACVSVLHEKVAVANQVRHKLIAQVGLLQEHRQALITATVTGEMEVPGVRR